MPLVLDLPPDLDAALTAEAARAGISRELMATIAIRHMMPSRPPAPPLAGAGNLLEYLGDFVGCVASTEASRRGDPARPPVDGRAAAAKVPA